MNDREFLNYCDSHVETPRGGFMPAQLFRLYKLAGDEAGGSWDKAPKNHIEDFGHCRHHIKDRVVKARDLLKLN